MLLTLLREADIPDLSSILNGMAFGLFLMLLTVCLCVWSFKQVRKSEETFKHGVIGFFVAVAMLVAGAPYIFLALDFLLG
jgi:ABC-type nickel/cobalt efflux system permease component RcnA